MRILLVFLAWVIVSLPVALFVGAVIRLGQHPLAGRLGEVEADRLVDEARPAAEDHALFV